MHRTFAFGWFLAFLRAPAYLSHTCPAIRSVCERERASCWSRVTCIKCTHAFIKLDIAGQFHATTTTAACTTWTTARIRVILLLLHSCGPLLHPARCVLSVGVAARNWLFNLFQIKPFDTRCARTKKLLCVAALSKNWPCSLSSLSLEIPPHAPPPARV